MNKKMISLVCLVTLLDIVVSCILLIFGYSSIILYVNIYAALIIGVLIINKGRIINIHLLFFGCYSYAIAIGPIWYSVRGEKTNLNIYICLIALVFYLLGNKFFNVFLKTKVRRIKQIKLRIPIFSKLQVVYMLYGIACFAAVLYAIQNRAYLLNNIQSNRIYAMSGNGLLLLMIKMFIIAIPLLLEEYWKKHISLMKLVILSIIGCLLILVTGFKAHSMTIIIVMAIMYLSKFKVSMLKVVKLGIAMFILYFLLDNLRSVVSGGEFINLISKIESMTSVGLYNFNRLYLYFPSIIPFQHGYTYAINFFMLLPGPDLDFTLWLKEYLNMSFSGGGVTPTIIGDFYINFGVAGIYIGMFLFAILGGFIDRSLYKYGGTFWPAYLSWQFSHCSTGGISNVWVDVLLFSIIYTIIMQFVIEKDNVIVQQPTRIITNFKSAQ